MKLLELFKGTGSVGKVAKKLGFSIISIDLEMKYKASITIDILKWDYKKYHNETGYIPDFIWASPPCNTFSPLAYPLKERNIETAEPYSERAKNGTKILYKTLEIINYFKRLNPNLGFCIENPKGMMRNDKKMKKLYRETTLYCLYGDKKYKLTDFWANFKMNLKEPLRSNCDKRKITSVVNLKLDDRYSIPSKLIKQILMSYLDMYNQY
jgi:site-specific DNA-cytosine methylase